MKKKYLGGVLLLNSLLGRTIAPEEAKAMNDAEKSIHQTKDVSSEDKSPDGSWLLTTLDGHSFGYEINQNVFVSDLSNQVKVNYLGTNTGEMAYRILTNDITVELKSGDYIDGQVIDLNSYPDGIYYIEVTKKKSQGSPLNPDTVYVMMNKESILVTATVEGRHGEFNPEKISYLVDPDSGEFNWTLKDETGAIILDGVEKVIDSSIITKLSENSYSIKATVKDSSKYGNQLNGQIETYFVIRHPKSAIIIDNPYNPDSIKGIQKIAESRLNWELREKDGKSIEQGEGEKLPQELLNSLSENFYEIEFTETSPEKETHTSKESFGIRFPESTTTIDRAFNPRLVVGSKKIPESTLEWVLNDDIGARIESGMGDEVPQSYILSLLEGHYVVAFTETSPEGDSHTSQETFTIRYPESTTTIDRDYNPKQVIGGKKIQESTLGWLITDTFGTKIKWGNEAVISQEILSNLPEGNYLVDFTETSPEEETHTSNGAFTIRYPESTVTVDRPYNPTSITGAQKIPSSTLEWFIRDETGSVIELGSGNDIPKTIIKSLSEARYIVEFTEKSPENETHTASEAFTVRYPKSTVTIDRFYNPRLVTGGKKIPESVLKWMIRDENGNELESGNENQIPYERLSSLPEGNYSVTFTETSPENETHTSEGPFVIRYPESVTVIDRPYNPRSVAGKKKIPDSTLEWAIRDEEGTIVESDEGTKIPQRIIVKLPEGEYLAEFTEISLEDKTHVSNAPFTIVRLIDPEDSEDLEVAKEIKPPDDPEDDASTLVVYYQEVRVLTTEDGSKKTTIISR